MRKAWLAIPIFAAAVALAAWWLWDARREQRYDSVILAASRKYQVDPALVKAVVWRESRFHPDARGKAGEVGLMQILAPAASEWAKVEHKLFFTHEELFDPEENAFAGAWYLHKLSQRYRHTDNPIPYALADYNAGRNNVLKWNRGIASTNSSAFVQNITFPATKRYVRAVMQRYEYYQSRADPGR